MAVNKKIEMSGLVQGVGFRPFVYQLALRFRLNGYVQNSSGGVSLEVEGDPHAIDAFMEALETEMPPLARIDQLDIRENVYTGYETFTIIDSEESDAKSVPVLPDIAICDHCLSEMKDPGNRRYHYPFINCTDCGPRYSIVETVPYDRPNTSMRFFTMCRQCEAEYKDPINRRYHAQPISCFECGPTLRLLDTDGQCLNEGEGSIIRAVEALKVGKIVALKGLGGFHLLCDATSPDAVLRLRRRKKRVAKPFAVMFPDIQHLKASAKLSAEEKQLIVSKEKPIVIVSKINGSMVCDEVAPGIGRIGVFLPYTPLHHLLLDRLGGPVVATSANLSDEPIIRESGVLMQKLGHVIDLVVDHDRAIVNANDDSVMQVVAGKHLFLRLARGFAPRSIVLPFNTPKKILAVGANQKNSMTLLFGNRLVTSPHIGDLNSIEAFEYFERTVETFRRIYGFEADVVVCDKHPGYETTRWARQLQTRNPKLQLIEVQHHYAHLLAVKAEHRLVGKVLGFAFDGTGYGDDGTVWGAEVMIADEQSYKRQFRLRPFRLLGGEKAVKEPRRSALALLFEYLPLDDILALDLPLLGTFTEDELYLQYKGWEKGLNAPYASSMGRLFDAVASLADIVQVSSYEGESGLKMEQYVDAAITRHFAYSIEEGVIDLERMLRAITEMTDRVEIVSMFFNTLTEIICDIAARHPELPLVFSGGVFQNRILLERIVRRCREMGRSAYFQSETPVNDGGIALGQAWFALHIKDTATEAV